MIGVYDYTVLLTYLSAIFAGTGIMISQRGMGHPFLGCLFLMLCGLCDSFDGKVARTKKNRTEFEQKFGIQIDSLVDLVAFGVLPACIGNALVRSTQCSLDLAGKTENARLVWAFFAFEWCVIMTYFLAALVRLAYFNVTEEERQKTENSPRKYYTGLPVTMASLIFPSAMLLQYLLEFEIKGIFFYFILMAITAGAFVSKISIPKLKTRGILILVSIGVLEVVIFILKSKFGFF